MPRSLLGLTNDAVIFDVIKGVPVIYHRCTFAKSHFIVPIDILISPYGCSLAQKIQEQSYSPPRLFLFIVPFFLTSSTMSDADPMPFSV